MPLICSKTLSSFRQSSKAFASDEGIPLPTQLMKHRNRLIQEVNDLQDSIPNLSPRKGGE